MTLPASGAISLNDVNVELNIASNTMISLADSGVRTLFGVASGAISLSNGYGKANAFAFSIAGGQNVNLRTAALAAGWDGTKPVAATITANIGSSSTGSAALTISGSFPNGVAVTVNSGVYVVGAGGTGGNAYNPNPATLATAGGAGGLALSVSTAVTIVNNGVIGGGGGGGGGSGGVYNYGGACGPWYSIGYVGGGGAGYTAGVKGSVGLTTNYTAATLTTGGLGGGSTPKGGDGGSLGSAGASGTTQYSTAGAGGAAGACTAGNANITWATAGTRYGALN